MKQPDGPKQPAGGWRGTVFCFCSSDHQGCWMLDLDVAASTCSFEDGSEPGQPCRSTGHDLQVSRRWMTLWRVDTTSSVTLWTMQWTVERGIPKTLNTTQQYTMLHLPTRKKNTASLLLYPTHVTDPGQGGWGLLETPWLSRSLGSG